MCLSCLSDHTSTESMETETKKRLLQKAKNIYYSLRSFLCFFVAVDPDDLDAGPSESGVSVKPGGPLQLSTWKSGGGSSDPDGFPFDDLPEDCQLHVFSYLSVLERGRAASVCRRWYWLLQSAVLWADVDLRVIPLVCRCPRQTTAAAAEPCRSESCYERYKDRIQRYVRHIKHLRPNVRRLSFAFDIGDYTDDWLDLVCGLLRSLRCAELTSARLNWKETPAKSWANVEGTMLSWSASGFNDFASYHRRRQRLFAGFLEMFVTYAANVVDLSMPFDWSSRSLQALGRLRQLQVLELDAYFVPQSVDQDCLDELMRAVPQLRHLSIAVCVSSGAGLVPYRINSPSLQHLDVANCSGFYLGQVRLPQLMSLVAAYQPSHGPLGAVPARPVNVNTIPCFYEVLRHGAPSLRCLNGHELPPDWSTDYTDDLDTLMHGICACAVHADDSRES